MYVPRKVFDMKIDTNNIVVNSIKLSGRIFTIEVTTNKEKLVIETLHLSNSKELMSILPDDIISGNKEEYYEKHLKSAIIKYAKERNIPLTTYETLAENYMDTVLQILNIIKEEKTSDIIISKNKLNGFHNLIIDVDYKSDNKYIFIKNDILAKSYDLMVDKFYLFNSLKKELKRAIGDFNKLYNDKLSDYVNSKK